MEGPDSIPERKEILDEKRKALLKLMAELQQAIKYIDWKQNFYDDVLAGKMGYYSYLVPEWMH